MACGPARRRRSSDEAQEGWAGERSGGRHDGVIVKQAGEPEDGATPFSPAEGGWRLSFLRYGFRRRALRVRGGCVGVWGWRRYPGGQ